MNSEAESYKKFAESFQEKWGEEPGEDKVSGLSYDAANIVFTAFGKNPNDLTGTINKTANFKGIYGDITFSRGVNTNSKIVTVRKGKFETMDGCKIPSLEAEKAAEEEEKKKAAK